MKSWKFRLGIVAVFALGVVVGAAVASVIALQRPQPFGAAFRFSRPEDAVDAIMDRLERELKLTGEQRRTIEPIVTEGFMKMRALRGRLTPEVEALVAETSGRIKQHLDPEQQRRLDEHYAEVRRRWHIWAGPAAPDRAAGGPAAPLPTGK